MLKKSAWLVSGANTRSKLYTCGGFARCARPESAGWRMTTFFSSCSSRYGESWSSLSVGDGRIRRYACSCCVYVFSAAAFFAASLAACEEVSTASHGAQNHTTANHSPPFPSPSPSTCPTPCAARPCPSPGSLKRQLEGSCRESPGRSPPTPWPRVSG